MFTAFENCKSIEEVANNAARFERMNLKREYTKNSNEIFSIPTTYEFYYENSEMKLLEDPVPNQSWCSSFKFDNVVTG